MWDEAREEAVLSLDVHAIVPGRSFCDFSLCKGVYRKGLYR
jgi:hypothetical protein